MSLLFVANWTTHQTALPWSRPKLVDPRTSCNFYDCRSKRFTCHAVPSIFIVRYSWAAELNRKHHNGPGTCHARWSVVVPSQRRRPARIKKILEESNLLAMRAKCCFLLWVAMLLWHYARNHVQFFRFYICGIKSYQANLLTARCYSIQASSSAMQKTASKVGRVVYSFAPNRKFCFSVLCEFVSAKRGQVSLIAFHSKSTRRSCAAFPHRRD